MKNSFETWLPKLVVAPAFVLGFAFIYGLMAWNGVLSVSASRMLPNYEWVGLAQYDKLWAMDRWWVALKNLGIFGVGYVGGSLAIGVLLAVLLDQKIRAEGALRTIYLYPMALSFVVTGTAWKWLLNPSLGFEKLMRDWGFTNFEFGWLVDTDMAIYCVVIAGIWQSARSLGDYTLVDCSVSPGFSWQGFELMQSGSEVARTLRDAGGKVA